MTVTGGSTDDALIQLYSIMQQDAPTEQKIEQALVLGEAFLGVDNAHLTRIDPSAGYWEAIASTDDADGEFPPGLVLDLDATYCRRVLGDGETIALEDAPQQGWEDDPAFEEHGLRCYHGTLLTVDDEPYGTLCFVSRSPRAESFTDSETLFAELVARLLEHELERHHHDAETQRRANSITVLSRVLRHNLRNDMTVVRGRIGQLEDRLEGDPDDVAELYEHIDRIIDLSDKARKLETVVSTHYDHEPVDIAALLERVIGDVSRTYPDVTATLDVEGESGIRAMPSLELALSEVIENAAKHAVPDPTVTVTVDATTDAVEVTVADDGPGLPDDEQSVLAEGVETPLVHGSGLGLWMAYWIVTNHDGTIEAVVDGGTTITVTLPRIGGDTVAGVDTDVRALQRGHDRFQAVFEEAFDAMVLIDDDRRIIDANQRTADLFAVDRDDLLGRTVREFAADRFDAAGAWKRIQETGEGEGRIPLITADGTERIVEYSVAADVVPGQHLLVGRDVTDRIERERRFEALTESYPHLCFIIDEVGIYRDLLASPESKSKLYEEPETLLGKSVHDVLPADVAGRVSDAIEATLEGDPQTFDLDLDVPAGERTFEATTTRLSKPIDGREAVVLAVRDVTEGRAYESDVTGLASRMELVLSATEGVVWEADLDTGEVRRQPQDHLFEGSLSDVFETIHSGDRSSVAGILDRTLESGDPFDALYRVDDDGDVRWIADYAEVTATRADGTPRQLTGLAQDVTNLRRRLQDAEAV